MQGNTVAWSKRLIANRKGITTVLALDLPGQVSARDFKLPALAGSQFANALRQQIS